MKKKLSSKPVKPPDAIAWYAEGECYLNLSGNYNYLEQPYYQSQDYENGGMAIHPACEEMLDAYITPLFLEKARRVGIKVPEYYLSNGYYEPPVIIDPMNPFILKSAIVYKPGRQKAIAKSMTRNFTYSFCCQEIKSSSGVAYFRSVLGWCVKKKYRELSLAVWNTFHIPLARIRLVAEADGELLLSDISPLPLETLTKVERKYVEERVQWKK